MRGSASLVYYYNHKFTFKPFNKEELYFMPWRTHVVVVGRGVLLLMN